MEVTDHYSRILIIACGLAAASIGVCNNAVGVFYTPVSEALHILRGSFAMHATLQLMASAVTALFVLQYLKHFSYKKLVVFGVLISIASTLCMALASNIYWFYLLGIIRGIGSGLFSFVPISMMINHWFIKKHGLAMSITLSFSGLAGAIAAPTLTACIQKVSYQSAYVLMAGMILVFTLPSLLFSYTMKPEESNTVPYGGENSITIETRKNKFKYLQISFFGLCIVGLSYPALTGITQHFTGIAESLGYTSSLGAMMMSCAMIGNIVMKLLIGYLSDRFSVVKAIFSMIPLNIVSLLLLSINAGSITLLTASFLFGSVYSVGAVGIPLFTRFIVGKESYASVYSIIGFLTNIGSSLSLTMIGFLYDYTSSYEIAVLAGIGINLINMLVIFTMYRKRKKQI